MPDYDDKQLNAIIDQAMNLEGKEREAYLSQMCKEDVELRVRIDRLIASSETQVPDDFLQPSPVLSKWIRSIYHKLLKIKARGEDQEE